MCWVDKYKKDGDITSYNRIKLLQLKNKYPKLD